MMDTPKLISFCEELKDTFDKLKQENTDLKKENQKLQDIKIIREKLVVLKQSQETVVTQINSILDDMNTLIDTHEDDDEDDDDEEQHILFTYEGVNYLRDKQTRLVISDNDFSEVGVWNKERKEIEWLGEDELEEHTIQSKKNGYQKIHYELIGSGKSVLVGGVISKINMTVINHTYESINLQSYKDGHYQKATRVLPGQNMVKISSVDTPWKVWKVNLPAPRPFADVEWKIPFNHGNNLTYHIRYKNK